MQPQNNVSTLLSDKKITVSYSPTVELMACLHAVAEVEHHPQIDSFAKSVLNQMPEDRTAQFNSLSKDTLNWRLAMDLSCLFEQEEIDSVIYFFRSLDNVRPAEFAAMMLSGLISVKEIEDLRASKAKLDSWDYHQVVPFVEPDLARKFILDDGSLQHGLISFLSWFWSVHFSKEWNRIGIFEMDAVNTERQLLNALGARQYLQLIHQNLDINETTISAVDRPWFSYPMKDIKKINIILSAYTNPHLMLNFVDGELTIYKPVDITQKPSALASNEIFKFLKAIDSKTKLLILQNLKESPKTNKELSDILDIAPSTVSVHLKTLRDAELVYPQPVGKAIYYRFLKENYHAQLAYLESIFNSQLI